MTTPIKSLEALGNAFSARNSSTLPCHVIQCFVFFVVVTKTQNTLAPLPKKMLINGFTRIGNSTSWKTGVDTPLPSEATPLIPIIKLGHVSSLTSKKHQYEPSPKMDTPNLHSPLTRKYAQAFLNVVPFVLSNLCLDAGPFVAAKEQKSLDKNFYTTHHNFVKRRKWLGKISCKETSQMADRGEKKAVRRKRGKKVMVLVFISLSTF